MGSKKKPRRKKMQVKANLTLEEMARFKEIKEYYNFRKNTETLRFIINETYRHVVKKE